MSLTEEKLLRRNILKLNAYAFFMFFLIIIPVIVPYWQSKGLTLTDVFVLQGIFGAMLIAFDMPAGYLADLLGRKKAMVFGSFITAAGFQVLWFGETFFHFVIYEVILGFGLSLQGGCDIAMLYNTVEKLQLKGRKAELLGWRMTSGSTGEAIASVLGGILAGYSLNWPAYANAMTAWMPFFIALTVYEPKGQTLSQGSHRENMLHILRSLFLHSKILRLAIVSYIFYGFATYCAIWTFQPYWKARGLDITWFGYLWALNAFMIAIVSRYAHKIEHRLGSVAIVILIAVLPIVGYLGMGLTGGLLGLTFMIAFPLTRGLNQVIIQDAINTRVPAEIRATTNSVGNLGVRALFIIFGPLIGGVLDSKGPDDVMILLGAVYAIGFFAIALPLLRERKHFQMV